LSRKERECAEKDELLEELTAKLFDLERERDDLRQTLAEVSASTDVYKRRADNLSDRIGSLAVSLSSMMDQQADLMKSVKDREGRVTEEAMVRRSKLEALIEMEDRLINDVKFDNEGNIAQGFQKQAKEMDAIAATIATLRN
jgi:hypothetical protein